MGETIKKNRNLTVEILRLINCIFVVCAHQCVSPLSLDGSINELYIVFECIFYKSVVIFFMISGFFMYDMTDNIWKDWLHMIKRYILDIFIPTLIVAFICIVFDGFFHNEVDFMTCMNNFSLKSFETLRNGVIFLSAGAWGEPSAHLWYIFSYAGIILFYPITRIILNMDRKMLYVLLGFYASIQITNDVYVLYSKWDLMPILDAIPRPIFYSACGYVFYKDIFSKLEGKNQGIIKNGFIMTIGLFLYIISFYTMYKMRYVYLLDGGTFYQHSSYYCFFCFAQAFSVALMAFNINIDKIIPEGIAKLIKALSKLTFGIYIVHYPITYKFIKNGVRNIFMSDLYTIWHWVRYFIIYGMIIFVLALIIVVIAKYIALFFKTIFIHMFKAIDNDKI